MKIYLFKGIQLIVFCLILSGCDRYLDIPVKGKLVLTTTAHYDQWLNNDELYMGNPKCNYLGDNIDIVEVRNPPMAENQLIYTWAPQFNFDEEAAPAFWGSHYAKINLFNTVLTGIDRATGGTPSQKRSLKAEALLGRAFEYLYLVNEYGKPYNAATANQDLAVPFLTSGDVTQIVPPRSTVAEIYKHIIDDITMAIPDLPKDNSANRFRGSTAAGYSVLARAYLYTGNYPEAQKNAELALASTRAVMMDYNDGFPKTSFISIHPDIIYARSIAANGVPMTLDFMRSFAQNDLRVKRFYISADNYKFTTRGATSYLPARVHPTLGTTNSGPYYQEMKLIAAECAARANNLTVALKHLDDVRKNRFAKATYVPFQSTDQEATLQEILKERRHELPLNELRWFDMRRLSQENRMQTVTRYDAKEVAVATLEPNSVRYTLQVPLQVINFNPNMQQNP
ncbi:RagB/SusD family nutrient uptake outer membrane protein [Pedobacter endophyticus]|uniref:RagB/SusD family nutrient uptake outer membrane protein n=1 Tax=Pedobacter endophyticus TaxID=2789740 RepID=A0A7S9L058_9SPHI|nr:RagB/SusD family nutrient uptake outer membrane protein [Pedobacter endophyticus]QPH39716.1 RagB/SusD family nutrient uptake outer membrane protein [Pedobacter endophyticus]